MKSNHIYKAVCKVIIADIRIYIILAFEPVRCGATWCDLVVALRAAAACCVVGMGLVFDKPCAGRGRIMRSRLRQTDLVR